jgi:hypothetical protein
MAYPGERSTDLRYLDRDREFHSRTFVRFSLSPALRADGHYPDGAFPTFPSFRCDGNVKINDSKSAGLVGVK